MGKTILTPASCSFGFTPHSPHEWREGFLWLRRTSCPGIPKTSKCLWEKANPAIGDRIFPCSEERCEECKDAPPLEHRCFLKLTRGIIVGKGSRWSSHHSVWNDSYGWQCECGKFMIRNRIDFMDSMRLEMQRKLEQTWPS